MVARSTPASDFNVGSEGAEVGLAYDERVAGGGGERDQRGKLGVGRLVGERAGGRWRR